MGFLFEVGFSQGFTRYFKVFLGSVVSPGRWPALPQALLQKRREKRETGKAARAAGSGSRA